MAQEDLDDFFLIINGCIIFFMQCGFAFLECGSVQEKNATNILMKNFLDISLGLIAFWIFGYAFAFGEGNGFIGHSFFCMAYLEPEMYSHFFFHFVFAATAATIVSGAVAERCDMKGYMVYSMVLTGFVYPVVAHWSWSSDGWLQTEGRNITPISSHEVINGTVSVTFQDFAGSGVVHLTGGVSAFVGAVMVGPREGRFDGLRMNRIPGHSVPLTCLGAFILLFGFFAFNGGSQAAIGDGDGPVVARAVVNTIVAGSFGGVVAMIIDSVVTYKQKRPRRFILSLLVTINGALAAMVSICGGCNAMQPWAAALTGAIAAGVYSLVSWLLSYKEIDDPLDAVAVHAGGGFWGLIATSIFNDKVIFSEASHEASIAWNLAGGMAITAWSGLISMIMFGLLKKAGWLRIPTDVQIRGLDEEKHGDISYHRDIRKSVESIVGSGSQWRNDLMSDIIRNQDVINGLVTAIQQANVGAAPEGNAGVVAPPPCTPDTGGQINHALEVDDSGLDEEASSASTSAASTLQMRRVAAATGDGAGDSSGDGVRRRSISPTNVAPNITIQIQPAVHNESASANL